MNWRGVKHAGVFQLVTTVLKVMPLLAVIVLAVVLLAASDASVIKVEPQPFTVSAMTAAATLTLWASARARVRDRAGGQRHRSEAQHSAARRCGARW